MARAFAMVAGAVAVWALAAVPAQARLDPAPYDRLLRLYVRQGNVDYAAIAKPANRAALQGYLAAIANAADAVDGDRFTRLAAWLNAYNALAIEAILKGGTPTSLWSRFNFFKADTYTVFGRRLSLHTLENEVIRPTFKDPRVHFALVCASKSCPSLRSEAYAALTLDDQLDDQAMRFLADPTKNKFDAGTKRVTLSPIFKWYAADFDVHGGVLAYLGHVAPPGVRPWLKDAAVSYADYDWSLNGTR